MQILPVTCCIVVVQLFGAISMCSAQQRKYDYRESTHYRELDTEERAKLNQVAKDMQVLEVAVKKHMLDHNGRAPKTLDALVPKYLPKLPRDPFYTPDSKPNKHDQNYQRSLSGTGYLYKQRAGPTIVMSWEPLSFHPMEDSWQLKSVGLPDFPFRYSAVSKNGRGLIRSEGYWGRLMLDVF